MTAIEIPAIARDLSARDLSVFLGDWRNTNANGRITRIVCSGSETGGMDVQTYGRSGGEMTDWGKVAAGVYSFTFDSREAGAFKAVFDTGTEEVHMQSNVKLGVLVVATFTKVTDRSGRSNYFDREFFHRISQ
jgi:hypothetical protein